MITPAKFLLDRMFDDIYHHYVTCGYDHKEAMKLSAVDVKNIVLRLTEVKPK